MIRDWSVRQRPTHAGLLGRATAPVLAPASSTVLDAIIVPAARPAENLLDAVMLAKTTGAHLVALCSREADPHEVVRLADRNQLDAITVIGLPRLYHHEVFDFDSTKWAATELPSICAVRDSDLSVKRNVGLALARLLDWRRVFFMDDDIRRVTAPGLLRSVAALGRGRGYQSVGMTIAGFPDNSVVCHANRTTGRYQDVFVSGSALAVDTSTPFDFFPDVYNEDWLFFHRQAVRGLLGRSRRKAWQLPYDPFADPKRAAGQEFGDVLAEGLYALLDENQQENYADKAYWSKFIDARANFINDIEARHNDTPDGQWVGIAIALQTARLCLAEITPDMCSDYVAWWRDDRDHWIKRMSELRAVSSMEHALSELDLQAAV